MMGDNIDDQTMMAYADGELDASDAARVEAALRDDPDIARRLLLFTRTRDALRSAAAISRDDPVPEAVDLRAKAAIDAARRRGDDTVIPFARPERQSRAWPAAIAAGLAVAGFVGGHALAPERQGEASGGLRFAILDTSGVSEALSRVAAGERVPVEGGEMALIASFRDAEGALCREFELDTADLVTVVSVACRAGDRWTPMIAVVAGADSDTQYAPASSLETLDAYLSAIGAGTPLSIEDEAVALAATD